MRHFTTCLLAAAAALAGCAHPPEITAVPASPFNRCEPEGMPFYLPKPLLVVAKNVRHIDEPKVGLTDPAPIPNAFDDQASYADLKANVTSPGAAGGDSLAAVDAGDTQRAGANEFDTTAPGLPANWRGAMIPGGRVQDSHDLTPDSFYTYQIMFVPDLSQKHGLRIKGKAGEVRAAMNMVNGWMYTGMGPYYLKDSSTAQNIMSVGVASLFAGRGAADVLESVTGLASRSGGGGQEERAPAPMDSDLFIDRVMSVARALQSQAMTPQEMLNYAEIAIYEPALNPLGGMDWQLIAHHNFSRQYFSPDIDSGVSQMLETLIKQMAPQPAGPGGEVESNPPADGNGGDTPGSNGNGTTLPGGPPGGGSQGPAPPMPMPATDGQARRAGGNFAPVVRPDRRSVQLPDLQPTPALNTLPAPHRP